MALTDKQRIFINEYLKTFNATQAAINAGYSEKTARSIGSENLTKPDIRAEIDARIAENTMSANEVLMRLTEIGRADIDDVMTVQGNLPYVDMDKAKQAAKTGLLKKIKVTKNNIEFELHDKMRALEMLGKYHALFTDKVKVEDWRSQAIADIKAGKISYEALREAFDDETAAALYGEAGQAIPPATGAGLIQ